MLYSFSCYIYRQKISLVKTVLHVFEKSKSLTQIEIFEKHKTLQWKQDLYESQMVCDRTCNMVTSFSMASKIINKT